MPRNHRFQAVVFDLDGTLIDSAPDIADALNMVMAELGRVGFTDAGVRDMIGTGWAGLLENAMVTTGGMPGEGPEWVARRFAEHYLPRSTRLSSLYPTVLDTVRELHGEGVLLGICTNKRQAATDVVIASMGLDRYMGAVVGGDTGVMKPDPDHVRAVLDRLGIDPGDAVMVGDSKADLDAARGLGMPCVLVSYGYSAIPAGQLGADHVIDRMEDLRGVLPGL